jgi:hypothetical protein
LHAWPVALRPHDNGNLCAHWLSSKNEVLILPHGPKRLNNGK